MATYEFYHQRADQYQSQVTEVEKIISNYAWSRVGLVGLAAVVIYFAFSNSLFFYILPVIVVLFFFLVKRQEKKEGEKKILENLSKINSEEAKAIRFESTDFPNGQRFADPHHPFGYDLDLFGSGSLYQYLNRSATQLGEEKLATDLSHLTFDKKTIVERQEAVRDLGPKVDFRQQAWAVGKQINDFKLDRNPLEQWLTEKPFIYKKKIYAVLKWVLPAITLSLVFGGYFGPVPFVVVLGMMAVQMTIAGFHSANVLRIQKILAEGRSIMGNYSRLFELLHNENFSSSLMQRHHALAEEAGKEVRKFSALVNALESRMNQIAMIFGNALFLYDFHTISNLEEWREKNGSKLPKWLSSLAEWDALLSLANLHYNFPLYAFGEITEELIVEGKEVGHPLIPSSACVTNNFSLGNPQGIMLITGANMAGKSTFLRTVGVNFILALVGSPVCASKWKTPIIALRSGMRTSDSLQDHQSYFYAELHRLHAIMEELRSGKRMLILLDEILKGTNSTDKQLGSRELLKQLKDQNALVLLATHDIALGDLQQQFPNQIINKCFEGKIEENVLSFDYKLNPGVAQKANATFLMRQMGIIPEQG
jgi:hypothetical protein